MSFLLIAGREAAQEPLTMRMNSDQDERAGTLVAVLLGLGSARLSWRVMRGVGLHIVNVIIAIHFSLLTF